MYGPILTASPHALELAAEWEQTGQLNPVLRPFAVFYGDDDERPDPARELVERGLAEKEGRVVDAVLDVLPSLCAAPLEYVADFRIEDRKYTALAARAANGGALAVRERDLKEDTDIVRFREVDPDDLVGALLDLLELQPGTGPLVSVNLHDIRQANEAVMNEPLSVEHKQLRSIIERPQAGPAIEVVVGVRDGTGKLTYTDRPLHIAALDWGHFITYSIGEGRDERFYGGPATPDHVRKALADLKASLTAPAI